MGILARFFSNFTVTICCKNILDNVAVDSVQNWTSKQRSWKMQPRWDARSDMDLWM